MTSPLNVLIYTEIIYPLENLSLKLSFLFSFCVAKIDFPDDETAPRRFQKQYTLPVVRRHKLFIKPLW